MEGIVARVLWRVEWWRAYSREWRGEELIVASFVASGVVEGLSWR